MKLFPTKEKGRPKQPKGKPWALSKVLCLSNKKQKALPPPPVPKTVATRRTTARTKSASRHHKKSLETLLLADHAKSDSANRNHWVPQTTTPAPYDELLNHATHNRRTVPTTTTSAPRNPRGRPTPRYPRREATNRTIDTRKSYQSSKRSEGTSSCTASLLDDTTFDSFSTGDDDASTLLDTTVVSAAAQQQGCQGCEDGNRELSLFLCGKILDHAGLRSPQDTREQQEAWDELILDLLLA